MGRSGEGPTTQGSEFTLLLQHVWAPEFSVQQGDSVTKPFYFGSPGTGVAPGKQNFQCKSPPEVSGKLGWDVG